jgi:hypothetical protein
MAKRSKATAKTAAKKATKKSANKSTNGRAKRAASGHKRSAARRKPREMSLLDQFLSLFGPPDAGKR